MKGRKNPKNRSVATAPARGHARSRQDSLLAVVIRGPWFATFPVLIPLFAACALAALKPVLRPRAADVVAIAAAVASTVFSVLLWNASRSDTIVYWLGNWTPRHGIVLGIGFTVDPLGAGLATLCGVLVVAAL